MARTFVPWGRLANGNFGILLDPATRNPLASSIEILETLPPEADSDNFDGRAVFDKATDTVYVFSSEPDAHWISLEGVPAKVGNALGEPPTSPLPDEGELYWDRDTEVLFLWSGAAWEPIGGRYAAQVIENAYVGNGTKVNYSTGSSSPIQSQYVEVFLDGVRQRSGADYNMVGTTVTFTSAPPNGVNVLIRSLVSTEVTQNAQATSVTHTASGSSTDFDIGQPGVDPAGVFVFLNGEMQRMGGDYEVVPHDTTITTLAKTNATTARVTTAQPHGIPVGGVITLVGFTESAYNNQAVTVTNVPSSTRFDFTVASSAPSSGTPNPVAYFTPAYTNDLVRFATAPTGGALVDIRSFRNIILSGAAGEANTIASTGTGVVLANGKVGTALRVKSLVAGANVSIVNNGNDVAISASNGLSFEDRRGINSSSYQPGNESYIGVRSTATTIYIDLSSIAQVPSNSGRRITIKDESGGAGIRHIQVNGGSAFIDGSSDPYIINTNYGAVTMVMDGNNWFVISEKK